MSKLELKHIQHYPIGINGIKVFREKSGKIDTLYGMQTANSGNLLLCVNECDWRLNNYWNYKPILYPLSDLIKPCLPEGKIPIIELVKIIADIHNDDIDYMWQIKDDGRILVKTPWDLRVEMFYKTKSICWAIYDTWNHCEKRTHNQSLALEWLFEHHFDVYGLIEQNLAIDINTLHK